MNLTDIDTSSLTDDGDTLELTDTFRLRLRIECDEDSSINDYDSDGRYEMAARDPHAPRPEGFNGAARKLWTAESGAVPFWWQPWDAAEFEALPEDVKSEYLWRIRMLVTYGFKHVSLRLEQCVEDDFGGEHWVEAGYAGLGGVDEFYPELIDDLASELPDIELEV